MNENSSIRTAATEQPQKPWNGEFEAVILCSGDFPTHSIPLGTLRSAQYLVACDDAGERLVRHCGIIPDAVVGDGDSMSPDFHRKYADRIHIVSEQDYNDQTKATRFCVARGLRRIAYIGSTGRREDHTIGNIALLQFYRRELGVSPVMQTDYGAFIPCSGEVAIATFPCQQVSIFNHSCSRMTGEGLRWQPYAANELWQTTLNEATGCEVTLHGDGEYTLFLTYEAKKSTNCKPL